MNGSSLHCNWYNGHAHIYVVLICIIIGRKCNLTRARAVIAEISIITSIFRNIFTILIEIIIAIVIQSWKITIGVIISIISISRGESWVFRE